MSNKSVVVLAPNGRRQTVKVTLNTTILQILEEVCKKQGYKAEEYDIRHHNKVVDASAIMRFTGLPNNAQLEMAAALKTRSETQVKVGLALESGSRVVGEFHPSDSLWHVVKTLCPEEEETDETSNILPVIFYMGREECGTENLKNTTLRSLGLTTGGAILRFFKKAPEDLHQQANVSAFLSRPTPAPKEPTRHFSSVSKQSNPALNDSDVSNTPSTSGLADTVSKTDPCAEPPSPEMGLVADKPSSFCSNLLENVATSSKVAADLLSSQGKSESEVMVMDYEDSSENSLETSRSSVPSISIAPSAENVQQEEPEETIVFLGERNAVLFDMATARACKPEDVPDDFFDLTLDDAKQLLRDLKRRQASLEEQPLVTAQYRDLEKSKLMLNALNQYKRCVIRIQFPNQLVLQGTFTPLEKVSHVLEFLKKFLEDPGIDFHIFTTPPKVILLSEQTLYDANCVPGAVVHFISSAPCPEHGCHLRKDIMAQVSSANAAASAARKSRGIANPRSSSSSVLVGTSVSHAAQARVPQASVSSTPVVNRPSTTESNEDPSQKKVPKWFKSSKN